MADNALTDSDVEQVAPAPGEDTDVADALDLTPDDGASDVAEEKDWKAEYERLKTRKEAGDKGAIKSERLKREAAEQKLRETEDRIAALEARSAAAEADAARRIALQAVDSELVTYRQRLIDSGRYDDESINELVAEKRQAAVEKKAAEAARAEATAILWAEHRRDFLREQLKELASDARDDGFEIEPDFSVAHGRLKLHVFAGSPQRPGEAARDEVVKVAREYIKELKRELKTKNADAGRQKNVEARKVESPDEVATSDSASISYKAAELMFAKNDPNMNINRLRDIVKRTAPQNVKDMYGVA